MKPWAAQRKPYAACYGEIKTRSVAGSQNRVLAILFLFMVGCLFLLSGCTHGLVGKIPTVSNPETAAEVLVFQDKHPFDPASCTIVVDGEDVVAIEIGEYARIQLDPGSHVIGVKMPLAASSKCSIQLSEREKCYLQVTKGHFGPKIAQVSKEFGQAWVAISAYIPLKKR